jgi:hypothetical protein
MTQEQRTDGQLESPLSQGRSSFPTPPVHTDLAAASAFAATDEPRRCFEIGFGEHERFLNA